MTTLPAVIRPDAERLVLLATYLVLVAIGVVLGGIEAFLVPKRLFGGIEGLSVVLALVGNTAIGSFGGLGTRTAAGAVAPIAGWFVAVGALAVLAPGGDVVLAGRLPADPGVVATGSAFLIAGVVAGALALIITLRYTKRGNAPTPVT